MHCGCDLLSVLIGKRQSHGEVLTALDARPPKEKSAATRCPQNHRAGASSLCKYLSYLFDVKKHGNVMRDLCERLIGGDRWVRKET